MDSLDNQNCSRGTIREMKNTIAAQNEKLCDYEKKLEMYNEVVTERNTLLESVKQFEQWRDKNDIEREKTFTEQLTSFEAQCEKLKKITTEKCNLQSKFCDLQKVNHEITDQLKTLKVNENIFTLKLENSEKNTKCAQNELCRVKVELEKSNCVVRKLKVNLKSIEEELSDKRKKIEKLTNTCHCLNDTVKSLEVDLKCTKSKLDEMKLSAIRAEENFKLDLGMLSDQLKMKCKLLDNLEIRFNEANCKIDDNKCRIKTLMKTLAALKEASLKKFNEIKNVAQKLKEENCTKEAELCRLKNNSKQLQRDNEFIVMEMKAQKKKLQEKECQLKQCSLPVA